MLRGWVQTADFRATQAVLPRDCRPRGKDVGTGTAGTTNDQACRRRARAVARDLLTPTLYPYRIYFRCILAGQAFHMSRITSPVSYTYALHFLTRFVALFSLFLRPIGLLCALIGIDGGRWTEFTHCVFCSVMTFVFVFAGGGPGDSGVFRCFGLAPASASMPDFADH